MSAADREKWDARYRAVGAESPAPSELPAPSEFLRSLETVLPRTGRALDVAGGAGRNAIWLARRGLDVTVVDISPEGLALARAAAEAAGVSLALVAADLEHQPLPPGPFSVITSFNYLRRALFPAMAEALAPGGLLVYLQPTLSNLQKHARPPAAFLLEDGELPGLANGLEIVHYEEGWSAGEDPRHEARLLARKTVTGNH